MSRLDSVVSLVRPYIAEAAGDGGRTVDATAGNGHDTLFLARLVSGWARLGLRSPAGTRWNGRGRRCGTQAC